MPDENKNTSSDVEFKAPDWINTALIQKALQNSGEGKLQAQNVSVGMATAPGDNYSSSIYRVKFELSDGSSRSYVIKGPPAGQYMSEATAELGAAQREGFILSEVVSQIQALLEEVAPGRFEPLAASCPLYGTDPAHFLLLEDLSPAGFKVADRKRGLDLQHSLLALQSLARYHAGSHALLRKKPELADELTNMWEKPHPATYVFVEGGLQMAADACRSWPGYEEYATLLDNYKPLVMESFKKICTSKDAEFTVLTHSDYWVNNMMFRYEEGSTEPQGHRMVDLTGCAEGSPTLDLLYFFSTSVTEEVAANNLDELLVEYHKALEEILSLLKLKAPSLATLQRGLQAHGPWALMGALNVIPLVRARRTPDLQAGLQGDSSALDFLYKDPSVKRWIQQALPEYKRRGWLPS